MPETPTIRTVHYRITRGSPEWRDAMQQALRLVAACVGAKANQPNPAYDAEINRNTTAILNLLDAQAVSEDVHRELGSRIGHQTEAFAFLAEIVLRGQALLVEEDVMETIARIERTLEMVCDARERPDDE